MTGSVEVTWLLQSAGVVREIWLASICPANETGDGKLVMANADKRFAGVSDMPSTVTAYEAPRGFLLMDTEKSSVSAVLSRNEPVP